jgi:hypothetical protein
VALLRYDHGYSWVACYAAIEVAVTVFCQTITVLTHGLRSTATSWHPCLLSGFTPFDGFSERLESSNQFLLAEALAERSGLIVQSRVLGACGGCGKLGSTLESQATGVK